MEPLGSFQTSRGSVTEQGFTEALELLLPQRAELLLVHPLGALAPSSGRLNRKILHPVDNPGEPAVAVERISGQMSVKKKYKRRFNYVIK